MSSWAALGHPACCCRYLYIPVLSGFMLRSSSNDAEKKPSAVYKRWVGWKELRGQGSKGERGRWVLQRASRIRHSLEWLHRARVNAPTVVLTTQSVSE
jgi:hypothetical protein